jgi:predicted dehydrogenase
MYAPAIDNSEALDREVKHFLFCIREGKRPVTDGRAGLAVIRILAAVEESIRKEGQRIYLPGSTHAVRFEPALELSAVATAS